MKRNSLILVAVLLGFLFSPSFLLADKIPIEGRWGEEGYRSFVPIPPSAYVNGHVLSLYFADTLSDLSVSIMDENGKVVYETVVSITERGCRIDISLSNLPAGEYDLLLVHDHRYLSGSFLR